MQPDIWSCPSFNELARDGHDVERHNRFHPAGEPRNAYITQQLEGRQGPAIVATDYIRAYPGQARAFVPMRYTVLGTDGYGRSAPREPAPLLSRSTASTSPRPRSRRWRRTAR